MQDLQELRDIYEIQRVKARYFRFTDTKQWSALRELLTDDMTWEKSPTAASTMPDLVGGDAFVAAVSNMMEGRITAHNGHMFDIEFVDARTATSVCSMSDWVEDRGLDRARIGFGHYYEEYRKGSDGRWRIAKLRLTRVRIVQLDTAPPLADPLRDWVRQPRGGLDLAPPHIVD